MSAINLWLIRHGQSTANVGTWSADPMVITLTEVGRRQALSVAAQIQQCPNLLITSPATRALETAQTIHDRWPDMATAVWPIQEFNYLSAAKYQHQSSTLRKQAVKDYWERCDPHYRDGADAESYADFIKRVEDFHVSVLGLKGFIVAVGHGQFIKAYDYCLLHGYICTPESMHRFRQIETADPVANAEIIKYDDVNS